MKLTAKLIAATLCLGLTGQVLATELKHWPADQAKQLEAMIAANANKGNFAVFDMDNTSYRNDLEEEGYIEFHDLTGVGPAKSAPPERLPSITAFALARQEEYPQQPQFSSFSGVFLPIERSTFSIASSDTGLDSGERSVYTAESRTRVPSVIDGCPLPFSVT